ncbi:hypothetical protein SALBM135S_03015 [Streptomyces alboniger]
MAQSTDTTDWVSRYADEVIAESERRAAGAKHEGTAAPVVVVASGLSPSGPIHLGNLREVMTPHLVADEIRRRGYQVRHLISGVTTTGTARSRPASPASTSPGPSTSASR